ncbi:MAG: hypothetical protein C0594_17605 [Marinilabiliales bacterium]|nr:MAG: hypothetical protein C0594_17605 [Marinilabiliales bacterium]
MKISFVKKILPHIVIIVIFLGISFTYFTAQLSGSKELVQSDVLNYKGMSKEIKDFREETGEEALWTNSMFGGMPAYLISVNYVRIISKVNKALMLWHTRPAGFVFLYLLGFYITLLIFRVNPWLSLAGAIAYAFSSYFFIIIEAGHITKIMALGYLPPIIGGIYLAYKRKPLLGAGVTALFLALQILVNHLQITYYTLLIVVFLVVFMFFDMLKNKEMKRFIRASVFLVFAAVLAVGSNFSSLYLTYDYGKDSMRGKSELTLDKANKTGGLDKDYATQWSYGIGETFTLFIPNVMGGASGGELSKKSEVYKMIKASSGPANAASAIKRMPTYWGPQPFTSGPVYVGAAVFFLFVLGLFLIKGPLKWWLLSITIFSIMLAWGKNFMFLTDFFLDYFPGYSKFRTVSMILVIAEFAIPMLALILLRDLFKGKFTFQQLKKPLLYSLAIVGGVCLLFAVMPGMFFSFTSDADNAYRSNPAFLDALISDRESLLKQDALRSLVFILAIAAVVFFFVKKNIKPNVAIIFIIAIFLIDMWSVNKRYLNDEDFITKREAKDPFTPSQADLQILKDKDPDYRVLNLSVSTFNDASTSYFHKSIGGYHGAKMERYQELIDFHIIKDMMNLQQKLGQARSQQELIDALGSSDVLNMLNTRYIILPTKNGVMAQRNYNALGNAWFVSNLHMVANADKEIMALNDFNPAKEAIVDERFKDQFEQLDVEKDSTATIKLISYKPNYLVYESNTQKEGLAVFSEIYYDKGWNAYIDGEQKPYFRTNYVLRGMRIPAGKHKVEFKFEPKMYYAGIKINTISAILLFIGLILVVVLEIRKLRTE